MVVKKYSNLLMVLVILLGIGVACDADQQDEANKLINEANVLIKKTNDAAPKITKLFNELVGEDLKKVEDLEAHKTDNKAKFDELIKLSEETEKDTTEAGNKFEQASKMKVSDKFKEYAGIKAQEFKKRAEQDKLRASFVKSFLSEKDIDKLDSQISDYNKKSEALNKEADELTKKADQIVKDNPTVFKKE